VGTTQARVLTRLEVRRQVSNVSTGGRCWALQGTPWQGAECRVLGLHLAPLAHPLQHRSSLAVRFSHRKMWPQSDPDTTNSSDAPKKLTPCACFGRCRGHLSGVSGVVGGALAIVSSVSAVQACRRWCTPNGCKVSSLDSAIRQRCLKVRVPGSLAHRGRWQALTGGRR